MPDPNAYLLRIMEGTRVVAEAPLIVHDKEAARRCWLEGFGQIAHMIPGATFSMMIVGCSDQEPAVPPVGITIQGAHSGLQIAQRLPGDNGQKDRA